MEGFSQYCESVGLYSNQSTFSGGLCSPQLDHLTENSSSLSDAGTTGSTRSGVDGDDENVIMLASSHPKKRTGRKKFKETRHPVYRGVRMRNSNRWVCEVREPNKRNRIWLGTYPTAEMAARAHDVAALALRGLKGCLNFADSAWRLPKPASSDPEDIQRAAAEAAAMFSNEENEEEDEEKEDVVNPVDENMINNIVKDTSTYEEGNNDCAYGETQKLSYYYMDDESIFNMPGLMNDMAEGLLLSPPSYSNGESMWDTYNPGKDSDMDLWNYSM